MQIFTSLVPDNCISCDSHKFAEPPACIAPTLEDYHSVSYGCIVGLYRTLKNLKNPAGTG